ncbi:MAG: acyltransferase [Bacteroidetes bacterium]|nr:acyltransferase [Bacteroidota bacterium]
MDGGGVVFSHQRFLIHFIYLQTSGEFKWGAFFSKRFWRIYPPYLLVLLFFYISRIDLSKSGLIHFFSHVFLVHNLSDHTFFSLNPSFWSIALEVQLYLLPAYLFYKTAGRQTSFLPLYFVSWPMATTFIPMPSTFVLKFWFTWAAGAFLADRYFQNKTVFNRPILWFLLFYGLFFAFKLHHVSHRFIVIPATLSCVALMVILYNRFIDQFAISRTIFKYLSSVGLISYSVYLIHQPFLFDLLNLFSPGTHSAPFNNLVSVVCAYTTIFLVSFALYNLVELKSIDYGKQTRKKG